LQAWCDRERARNRQDEDDRIQRETAQESARRYWDDETGFARQLYAIHVIVEVP
jgi:hypothetical protein